jgi:hypothetical protein
MDVRRFLRDDLDGFDLDLVGLDCVDELHDEWMEAGENFKFHCPFRPGCGATRKTDCPLIKRRVQVLLAPETKQ